jgi:hypothetical protein
VKKTFSASFVPQPAANNKQLLDEAEHDIKNYSDRGQFINS